MLSTDGATATDGFIDFIDFIDIRFIGFIDNVFRKIQPRSTVL